MVQSLGGCSTIRSASGLIARVEGADAPGLGLVYPCEAHSVPGGWRVEIDLSMTAPGCGMGEVLRAEVASRTLAVPGVREVGVDLVWDPPWDLSHLSEAARLELGLQYQGLI